MESVRCRKEYFELDAEFMEKWRADIVRLKNENLNESPILIDCEKEFAEKQKPFDFSDFENGLSNIFRKTEFQ